MGDGSLVMVDRPIRTTCHLLLAPHHSLVRYGSVAIGHHLSDASPLTSSERSVIGLIQT